LAKRRSSRNENRRDRNENNSKMSLLNLRQRKRYCYFCKQGIDCIDYKEIALLRRYISDKGKIRPRRVTGNCIQHQKKVATAIKKAREVALIPYFVR